MPRKTGAYDWLDKHGIALYEAGQLDKQIAKAAGCARSVVCVWRRKRGLPAIAPHGSEDWRACHESWIRKQQETIACVEMGLTDREAVQRLGLKTLATFQQRRQRLGLPPGRYERVPKPGRYKRKGKPNDPA